MRRRNRSRNRSRAAPATRGRPDRQEPRRDRGDRDRGDRDASANARGRHEQRPGARDRDGRREGAAIDRNARIAATVRTAGASAGRTAPAAIGAHEHRLTNQQRQPDRAPPAEERAQGRYHERKRSGAAAETAEIAAASAATARAGFAEP